MPDNYADPYRKYPLFKRNLKLEELYEKYKQKYDQKFVQQQFGKKELLWLTAIFLILFSIPFTLEQIQQRQSGLITATSTSKSLSLEAEEAILPPGVQSGESVSASNGKYIQFGPKGAIMDVFSCPKIPSNISKVEYSINVPETGKYYIWIRLMSPDLDNNSLYFQIDDKCPDIVGDYDIPENSWEWINRRSVVIPNHIIFDLKEGFHTLLLYQREANLKVDKIILTTDPSCIPVLTGINCLNPG